MSAQNKPGVTTTGDGQELQALAAQIAAAAPPLSDDQRRQLAALLAPRTPPAGRSAAA